MGHAELLQVRDVALRLGGIIALDGVSFERRFQLRTK